MTSTEKEIAFPILSRSRIAALEARGRTRRVEAGEVLWSEGDRGFAFFVVLSGRVEIIETSDDEVHLVAVHEPGEFTGDIDVLTGRASLVTARVQEGGEVLELDTHALQRVVGELPEISEILLKAFLMRRTLLLNQGFSGFRLIGSRFSPQAHRLREFATRNAIPFTWIDLEQDEQAEFLLRQFGVTAAETPIVICRDGKWMSNPSVELLAHHMGMDVEVAPGEIYDLVIVGAGPAGLAASVYAASEGLKTLMLDGTAVGGQAGTSSKIENYLGFPTGISGSDLAANALLQAQKFGARISVPEHAVALRCTAGERVVVLADGTEINARAVLVACGVEYRRIDVPEMERFEGAGVYYAASDMEARLCMGDEVAVVGGGNSAGQAAIYLSRYARRVNILIRGDDLGRSMSRYLVDRVESTPNIVVHRGHTVVGLAGEEGLSSITIREEESRRETILPVRALFMFIGAVPHTDWLRGCVAMDRKGFILTGSMLTPDLLDTDQWKSAGRAPFYLETSLPGVFAAGDVRSESVKRVASAVGEGAIAVSFVHAHIGAAV
jgi:thioredoxin reductase (NADPH)